MTAYCCRQEKKEIESEEATTVEEEEVEDTGYSMKDAFDKLKQSLGWKTQGMTNGRSLPDFLGVAASIINKFAPEEDLKEVLAAFQERY